MTLQSPDETNNRAPSRLTEEVLLTIPCREIKKATVDPVFGDHADRHSAIAAYRAHNARVREIIPADRLLVFDVRQGWGPLCDFLGVQVPATAFPRSNPRSEFWDVVGGEPGVLTEA